MNRSLNKQHCYQTLTGLVYDVRELSEQEHNFLSCLLVLCGEDLPEMTVFETPVLSLIVRFGVTESSPAHLIFCDLKARATNGNRNQSKWPKAAPGSEMEWISLGVIGHLPLKERVAKIQALLGDKTGSEARMWAGVIQPDYSSFEYAAYQLRQSGF